MKKMIDNSIPIHYDSLNKGKSKKEAQQIQRGSDIQRENQILIQKLTTIMNRPVMSRAQTQGGLYQQQQQSTNGSTLQVGGSSSRQMYSTQSIGRNASAAQLERSSLNKEVRKKRFVEIVIENQALLRRIQGMKSEYNVKAWNEERARNERFISNISEYQFKDLKPNKTFVKLGVWSDVHHPPATAGSSGRKQAMSSQASTMSITKPPVGKLQPLFKKSAGHSNSRIIFKNGKKIGTYIYLVEVKVLDGMFLIKLENLQLQGNDYSIEFSESEGMEILESQCKNNVETLLEKIVINDRQKSIQLMVNRGDVERRSSAQSQREMQRMSAQTLSKQLKVMEEREEEDEQSMMNSRINDQSVQQQENPGRKQQDEQEKLGQETGTRGNESATRQKEVILEHERGEVQANQQENGSQQQKEEQQQDIRRIDSDQESGNEYEELDLD